MKKPGLDELLTGYLDDELSARQKTEIQRLLAHDPRIVERLHQLEQMRTLYNALPVEQPPAHLSSEVSSVLARRTLLELKPVAHNERKGARSLMLRKVFAAAAMLALAGVLATVVYTIVAPSSTTQPQPLVNDAGVEPVIKPVDTLPEVKIASMEFDGRLELQTDDLIAMDAFINRAVNSSINAENAEVRRDPASSRYFVTTNRRGIVRLLSSLDSVWTRFNSTRLIVETAEFAAPVTIESITPSQIAQVVSQESTQKALQVASHFADMNTIDHAIASRNPAVGNIDPGIAVIPKPLLTGPREDDKKPADDDADSGNINLTIIVRGQD